jgi:hypothetical protein
MRFKVFDKFTKEDITNRYDWVITPDGKLLVNNWGDLLPYSFMNGVYVFEQDVDAFLKGDISKAYC